MDAAGEDLHPMWAEEFFDARTGSRIDQKDNAASAARPADTGA